MVERTAISFELEPPSVEEMAKRIESTLPTYPYLVAERNGQVIGYADASQHRAREAYRWSVDVTVYISPEAHRSGVGRALYVVLLPTLKRQGFHAAYAGIELPNDGSVGRVNMFQVAGFMLGMLLGGPGTLLLFDHFSAPMVFGLLAALVLVSGLPVVFWREPAAAVTTNKASLRQFFKRRFSARLTALIMLVTLAGSTFFGLAS